MRVLNVSFGQDTGGQQWRLARAWRRFRPDDSYISATHTPTFYPVENLISRHHGKLERDWFPNADVVHVNNDLQHVRRPLKLDLRQKPVVVHHHGTMFRTRPEYHLAAMRDMGAVAIASSLDLVAIAPAEVEWMPLAYELEELQLYRQAAEPARPDDGAFRIAHAPTNRPIKGTDALIAAVDRLREVGVKVELDIIEGVKNVRCLERKARADVFVDQLLLGYGANAVEAWGMGIPVIAGVQPERCPELIRQTIPDGTPALMEEVWGQFPFYSATEQSLYTALVQMLSPVVRQKWAAIGMEHFMKFHEASSVVDRLEKTYRRAMVKRNG
jgi:glycosyltransferase involved in cell wall biosynthesis